MTIMRKRLLALLGAASVALLLPASNHSMVTDAAWQDTDITSGSFAAITIPAPTLNGDCSYNGLVNPYVRIYWRAPGGYSAADAELQLATTGLGSVLAPVTGYSVAANTTGTAAEGYVTDVRVSLVDSLIGLGSEFRLAIVMKRYGWTSKEASVRATAGIVAGIGSSCTNITPAG